MAFILQCLLEQGVQILVGRGMVEVTFCDSVEEWKVSGRILICGRLSESRQYCFYLNAKVSYKSSTR